MANLGQVVVVGSLESTGSPGWRAPRFHPLDYPGLRAYSRLFNIQQHLKEQSTSPKKAWNANRPINLHMHPNKSPSGCDARHFNSPSAPAHSQNPYQLAFCCCCAANFLACAKKSLAFSLIPLHRPITNLCSEIMRSGLQLLRPFVHISKSFPTIKVNRNRNFTLPLVEGRTPAPGQHVSSVQTDLPPLHQPHLRPRIVAREQAADLDPPLSHQPNQLGFQTTKETGTTYVSYPLLRHSSPSRDYHY